MREAVSKDLIAICLRTSLRFFNISSFFSRYFQK
nr:MAG TPA: hypothetical protein [Siphoviridae sp. ct8IY7]